MLKWVLSCVMCESINFTIPYLPSCDSGDISIYFVFDDDILWSSFQWPQSLLSYFSYLSRFTWFDLLEMTTSLMKIKILFLTLKGHLIFIPSNNLLTVVLQINEVCCCVAASLWWITFESWWKIEMSIWRYEFLFYKWVLLLCNITRQFIKQYDNWWIYWRS